MIQLADQGVEVQFWAMPELLVKLSSIITSTFNKYLNWEEGEACFIIPLRCEK